MQEKGFRYFSRIINTGIPTDVLRDHRKLIVFFSLDLIRISGTGGTIWNLGYSEEIKIWSKLRLASGPSPINAWEAEWCGDETKRSAKGAIARGSICWWQNIPPIPAQICRRIEAIIAARWNADYWNFVTARTNTNLFLLSIRAIRVDPEKTFHVMKFLLAQYDGLLQSASITWIAIESSGMRTTFSQILFPSANQDLYAGWIFRGYIEQ